MDWLQVVVLALIQGLTEFLPISSSAHLILPGQLLAWPDQGLAFDVGVHVGTLTAVVLYFRRELIALTQGALRGARGDVTPEGRLALLLILGTIPAVMAGLMWADLISHYGRSLLVIAGTTLIFGALLWWADSRRCEVRSLEQFHWKDALIVGAAQAVAMIPGTSRSGITITAALMLGFERQAAARFSFLLSIPAIGGAGVLVGLKSLEQEAYAGQWLMIIFGTLVAAFSAWACIHIFLKLLDRIGMFPFVIYRLLLGVALLGIYFAG